MKKIAVLDKIIFPHRVILQKIQEYALLLNKIYAQKKLIIISILNGAVFFTVYLLPLLKIEIEIDFIAVSSYHSNEKKPESKFYKELKINVTNENLLIIEDIVDSGHTLNLVYKFLKQLKPKNIRVCTLIKADERRNKNQSILFPIDYLLLLRQKFWIVGFGIDFEEKFRNLLDIYSIRWLKSKELIKIK